MAEPYYRISTAQSDLEVILYQQTALEKRLSAMSAVNSAAGGDGIVSISAIKQTHRFPFHAAFLPVIISANQFITYESQTNRSFKIEYGGDFAARMYQAIDISAGTVAPVTVGDTISWAYCDNFVASLLQTNAYKVSSDTLYEFPGHMYFIWYSIVVSMALRPALMRCLHECCFEFKWINGVAAGDLANQYGQTTAANALALQHPYSPLQSFETTHGAFTLYIPLSIFTLANVKNADPIIAAYALERKIETTLNPLLSCINVFATTGADSGLIDPTATNPTTGIFTWTTTPTITAMRLIVEFIVVQKDLQNMLALNPHGFMIRQYFDDMETLTDKTFRDISATKIIETVYMVCRHEHNVTHTAYPQVTTAVTLTGGDVDEYHKIDPFFIPVNEAPINTITIAGRGQTFYKDLKWEEISAVNQFLFGTATTATTTNHCIGVVTFAHHYFADEHSGSYNSGFGPNIRVSWRSSAYSSTDPGRINFVLQCINMVLIYRGALSIRYT